MEVCVRWIDVDERESCTMCKVCVTNAYTGHVSILRAFYFQRAGNAECRTFVSGRCRCVDREYMEHSKQSFIIRGFGNGSGSARAKLTNSNKLETIYGPYKYKSTFWLFCHAIRFDYMPHLVRSRVAKRKNGVHAKSDAAAMICLFIVYLRLGSPWFCCLLSRWHIRPNFDGLKRVDQSRHCSAKKKTEIWHQSWWANFVICDYFLL